MIIKDHFLHGDQGPVAQRSSPNVGDPLTPRYLVMHFTAGASAESSINHLCNPGSNASAHLVIGRDGAITQLVPFNRVAWHAGKSEWHGLVGLNKASIGIELDNAGELRRTSGGWVSWFGAKYPDGVVDVLAHKYDLKEGGWHRYTQEQLVAALAAAAAICREYKLVDVLGHDDIAPGRKRDPGPAFPMEQFRSYLLGRRDDQYDQLVTLTEVNIRQGPGTEYEKLTGSPLPAGRQLALKSREGIWCFVEVLEAQGKSAMTGWVHGNYIG